MGKPRVYISYTADSSDHRDRLLRLADSLQRDGAEIWIDEWSLRPGDEVRTTVKRWVSDADFVLIAGNRRYRERAADSTTSLGFEAALMEEALRRNPGSRKFIPILLAGTADKSLPRWLQGRVFIDFRAEVDYQNAYRKLLHALGLAEAPPRGAAQPSVVDDEVVVMSRLRATNFRCFKDLELEFASKRRRRGQWTLIVGDNGAGKSTLLRAIALAVLAGDSRSAAIVASDPAPLVHQGSDWARVEVKSSAGISQLTLRTDRGRETIADGHATTRIPVFGYGCGRGSALGGPDRAVELDRPLDAVATLFGVRASLIHAETWLRSLELGALKSSSAADLEFVEAVHATVVGLLPGVERLTVTESSVMVESPEVGSCDLAGLSDGYLTTLGWILDLVARWAHEARQRDVVLDAGFNERMTGLVLLDEIDLHLHPQWQTHVVRDIRQAFPRMSFVATTHNPLTLLGAEAGELHLMERDAEGSITCRQIDLPRGVRADQVLTGEWFGLSSTLDADTQRLLARHRRMLSTGVARDASQRLELEHALRLRLGSYSDTSEDRLALEVVAQFMGERDAPLTSEERKALHENLRLLLEEELLEENR